VGRAAAFVVPLCLDTFAVSAALGAGGLSRRQRVQVSLLFPAAEVAMPLVGVLLGREAARALSDAADYVAAALLVVLAIFLLMEGTAEAERAARLRRAGGWAIVPLALVLALDELALGFAMGLLRLTLAAVVIIIAVQAVVASQLGLRLGERVSGRMRESADRVAGVALLGIATFLVIDQAGG
jgi:putative Mn2+ efflux pump MntP